MVTAAAPVSTDSNPLPQAAAGTPFGSTTPPASFHSVIQSFPGLPIDSNDPLSTSKLPVSKTDPFKNTDERLPAPVSPTAIPMAPDAAPKRPWTPPPSLSLPAQPIAPDHEPVTEEVHQSNNREWESSLPALSSRAPNLTQQAVGTSPAVGTPNTARTMRASQPDATQEVAQLSMPEQSVADPDPAKHAIPAATRDRTSNLTQSDAAASRTVASPVTALATYSAIHEPAPSIAPSALLGAPSLPQVSQVESSPESRQPANSSRSSETHASQQPSVDPALFTKGLAAALAPQNANLAFSIKMMESTSAARRAQQVAQPDTSPRNPAAVPTKSEGHSAASTLSSSVVRATPAPAILPAEVAAAAATVNQAWNGAAPGPQLAVRPDSLLSEPHVPANLSTVAALHEAQPVLPEAPRPNAAGEILLQLGGKDQTAAAIRVTDRAGTVNVSVHATDPDLRSSLRSNLGELASQLTHQGWKTEVVKSGTVLTRSETPQDSRQDGQRSPGQQQPSSQGERQPQRDRRASSGQWQAAFEEQSSGNSGNPGGTN
jgi:hypothetical protein